MELFKAHNQWKNRPQDERFKDLASMHSACNEYREVAASSTAPYSDIRVEALSGELALVGKTGVPATLTHWSMGQLSARAGAPAGYLRELPATLAARNLNHGLKARSTEDQAELLFHSNGSLVLRAMTSDKYSRIWNSDITHKLIELQDANPQWTNPMAYKVLTPAKNGGWPEMSTGMEPSGLYASDHDMFAFLVDESKTIDSGPSGLNRGFFVWNSEVGASSFGFMAFLYDRVCGNNIVWGASQVTEFKMRHVGNADTRAFTQLQGELRRYCNSSTSDIEAKIQSAKNFELGTNKTEVLESLFAMVGKLRIQELSKSAITQAVDTAERRQDRYGNPNTLWSAVSGLTENSQNLPYADERVKVDRAAGKLLKAINF